MWSRVPPEHWANLQVIDSPLREHRTAAAVVSLWDAYCSFQTEVVGQDALELGLREDYHLFTAHRAREFYWMQLVGIEFGALSCKTWIFPLLLVIFRNYCYRLRPRLLLLQRLPDKKGLPSLHIQRLQL